MTNKRTKKTKKIIKKTKTSKSIQNRKNILIFAVLFGCLGLFLAFRSFAESTLVLSQEAETMTLEKGAQVTKDRKASGGSAVTFTSNVAATSQIVLNQNVTSIGVVVQASKCRGAESSFTLSIDGKTLFAEKIGSNALKEYSTTIDIAEGTHSVTLSAIIAAGQRCSSELTVDVLNFYGDNTPQPDPGPTPTPDPSPTPTPQPSSLELPKQGISTGYKILTRSQADRKFELDKIQEVFNGHPGYVRFDSTPSNQAQVDILVAEVIARGFEPMLILYGTAGPRSVDNFGSQQATKWKGKVKFFEIANEPDLNGWAPEQYADFVKGTSSAIKASNPDAIVIAGALWKGSTNSGPQEFTRALATRANGSFDMLSLHMYDDPKTRASWNIWDMVFPRLFGVDSYHKGNTCREILDANGLNNVSIISTETGGPITTYGEDGQNTIVAHDFDALTSGLLQSMAVYSMKDDDVAGFGLLRPDNTPRPAFNTFKNRAY